MTRRGWTNLAIILVIVALVAAPLAIHGSAAAFEGSDEQGSTAIRAVDPHYRVWFHPFFEPASGEVESGLFALQAGLGGVVLGFVLGQLSARRRRNTGPAAPAGADQHAGPDDAGTPATGSPPDSAS
jgi:cobalt/nickel transport protein